MSAGSREEIVRRGRSALSRNLRYGLGRGGYRPTAPHPDQEGFCDCTGFVAWALGISRDQGTAFPGRWIETSRMHRDAVSTRRYFTLLGWREALPGDLLLYPDSEDSEGHVGIITSVGPEGPERVLHCNATTRPSALAEEPLRPFWRAHRAVVVRATFIEGGEVRTEVTCGGKKAAGVFLGGKNYLPASLLKELGWKAEWDQERLKLTLVPPSQGG